MRDYGVSVLEQYPIEVYNVRRVRGAVLCETDQGLMLLKEAQIWERRLPFLIELYRHLEESGEWKIDSVIANKEGEYLSGAEDETKYILKKWYQGKECDVYKESEILEGTRTLGRLHRSMIMPRENGEKPKERTLKEEYFRHNRELRKVSRFIRERSVKGSFERTFLKGYDTMYSLALAAEERLDGDTYLQMEKEVGEKGTIMHGEYNYHNLLMCEGEVAVTGFERAHYGIQMEDLYYFMRKILEKHQYTPQLGAKMLQAYDKENPLGQGKREYLAVRFAYPEKFWKISNMYYHSNKAWIPEKNTEKLKKVISQTEEKKYFLESVFDLYL